MARPWRGGVAAPQNNDSGLLGADQVEQRVVVEAGQRPQLRQQSGDRGVAERDDLPMTSHRAEQEARVFLPRAVGGGTDGHFGEVGTGIVNVDPRRLLGARQQAAQ